MPIYQFPVFVHDSRVISFSPQTFAPSAFRPAATPLVSFAADNQLIIHLRPLGDSRCGRRRFPGSSKETYLAVTAAARVTRDGA